MSGDTQARGEITRLALLRWLTMVGYSMSYVVIPTLVFERTRSAAAAGLALVAEGLVRAGLAVAAGPLRRAVGPARTVHVAEVAKLAALGLLAWSLQHFALGVVVAAIVLYQLGYSLSLLKLELRCGALGELALPCQAAYRRAEMLAVPPVLVTALVSQYHGVGLQALLAGAAIASLLHHVLWHRLVHALPQPAAHGAGRALTAAAVHMLRDPMMTGGLVASMVVHAYFSWLLLATPFALAGRDLFGLDLSSAAGGAVFKALAAGACLAASLGWVRVARLATGDRVMTAAAVLVPLAFLAALVAAGAVPAVVAGCATVVLALGASSWLRAWRLQRAPAALREGIATLYLAVECLGMTLAGLGLLVGRPVWAALVGVVLIAWGLRGYWFGAPGGAAPGADVRGAAPEGGEAAA